MYPMSAANPGSVSAGLGLLLRSIRQSRNRSIRQLAAQSGVGRSTLSRWETGAARPDKNTLEALLSSLNLSAEERLMCAPFLVERRQPDPQSSARRRLLRAARLRNRLSLSQAAAKIGVSKAALSRWETGERHPGKSRLAEAAEKVGATPCEVLAIASPGLLLGPVIEGLANLDLQVQELRRAIPQSFSATKDLEFLRLDAVIAQRPGPDAKRLRLELRAAYVEWLGWWYRDAEAGSYATRLLPALRKDPTSDVWGRVLRAYANFTSEFRSDPEAGIELLSEACKSLRGGPSEGFVRRELAGLFMGAGDWSAAHEQLQRARDSWSGEEDPAVHAYCCSMIEAELWSSRGDHDRATSCLPTGCVHDPYLSCASAIGRSRILSRAGDGVGARKIVSEAMLEAETERLTHFWAALAKHLRGMGDG